MCVAGAMSMVGWLCIRQKSVWLSPTTLLLQRLLLYDCATAAAAAAAAVSRVWLSLHTRHGPCLRFILSGSFLLLLRINRGCAAPRVVWSGVLHTGAAGSSSGGAWQRLGGGASWCVVVVVVVGQAAWGVVRWGPSVRVYNIYIATRADDPPVRESGSGGVVVVVTHTHTQVVSMQSCTHPCTDPLLLIIIIIIMVGGDGAQCGLVGGAERAAAHQWWASYKVRIAQSCSVFYDVCVCVCMYIYIYTPNTHTHTQQQQMVGRCVPAALVAAARISTRPPLTAASQQDTHTHTHVHNTRRRHNSGGVACVVGACVVCEPVVGPRPSMWPVIGTSEALLLLEREPNAHTHDTPRHTHTHVCVCACACDESSECAGNKNQDYIICISLYLYLNIDRERERDRK